MKISPGNAGATTPEFMVVKTPAAREAARVSRKRKCLFDDIIVLPNKYVRIISLFKGDSKLLGVFH